MKLILDNNQLNEPPESLLRQAGFSYFVDRNTDNESFTRQLNRGYYPRFHLYLEQRNGKIIFNLHLDQKQASYKGAYAHNGEYDGKLVAAEIERIKSFVINNGPSITPGVNAKSGEKDVLDKIRPKYFNPTREKVERKSWWRKFFR